MHRDTNEWQKKKNKKIFNGIINWEVLKVFFFDFSLVQQRLSVIHFQSTKWQLNILFLHLLYYYYSIEFTVEQIRLHHIDGKAIGMQIIFLNKTNIRNKWFLCGKNCFFCYDSWSAQNSHQKLHFFFSLIFFCLLSVRTMERDEYLRLCTTTD